PSEHWDPVALWRLIELKRALHGLDSGDPEFVPWEARLEELEVEPDPLDELLAELEAGAHEPPQLELFSRAEPDARQTFHRVRLADGTLIAGTWLEIVRQLRDVRGREGETIAQFMRREAEEARATRGIGIPSDDPEAFVRASARAGLLRIER